jgi:hypothetical protein
MSKPDLNRAFMTGSDVVTEWQLPWMLDNYQKHNDTPITVVDFGMSDKMLRHLEGRVHSIGRLQTKRDTLTWLYKPGAMLNSPYRNTCWLDTDLEIKGDISGIFDNIMPEKLHMVVDRPWTKRGGNLMYNSGVVAFTGKPMILQRWAQACHETPQRGDQETLHAMLDPLSQTIHIKELNHKYNVLRLDHIDKTTPKEILVNHWTGQKGNEHIRSLMNE